MTNLRTDPLLAIARVMVTLMMGLAVIVAVSSAIAMPFILFFRSEIMIALADEMPHAPNASFALAIAGVLALICGVAVLAYFFVRHLRRIIDTVGAGDPFVPINAARLKAMGWLTLAIEGLTLPLAAIAMWLDHLIKGSNTNIEFEGSFSTLFMALVLFILARVFREGTRLRDEVEGTV